MNREQQLKLLEHVQAARALTSDPIAHASRERPFRLTLVFLDGAVQKLHFATGWEAEHGLTVLVEFFPEQIDLQVSGVECVLYAHRDESGTQMVDQVSDQPDIANHH
jgi:hypothetical protein